jgi:hypothetical protein
MKLEVLCLGFYLEKVKRLTVCANGGSGWVVAGFGFGAILQERE